MKRIIGLPLFLLGTVLCVTLVWVTTPQPGGDKTFTVKKADNGASKPAGTQPIAWQEGKTLFKGNCASCHNAKADGTGPALINVSERWKAAGDYKGKTGDQWLHMWIHNWHDAVSGGYKYAVDMSNSRPSEMNFFSTLKDPEIDKILLYVNNPDGMTKTANIP